MKLTHRLGWTCSVAKSVRENCERVAIIKDDRRSKRTVQYYEKKEFRELNPLLDSVQPLPVVLPGETVVSGETIPPQVHSSTQSNPVSITIESPAYQLTIGEVLKIKDQVLKALEDITQIIIELKVNQSVQTETKELRDQLSLQNLKLSAEAEKIKRDTAIATRAAVRLFSTRTK